MTRISVLLLLCLAAFCGTQAFFDFRGHYVFRDFRTLATQIGQGRIAPEDADRIAPALARLGPVECRGQIARDVAIVQLYAADLAAFARDMDPAGPADAPALRTARTKALDRLDAALACVPLDGDLWLRSAVIAQALGKDDGAVAARRALSERTTPFEGWIANRRAAFFPESS